MLDVLVYTWLLFVVDASHQSQYCSQLAVDPHWCRKIRLISILSPRCCAVIQEWLEFDLRLKDTDGFLKNWIKVRISWSTISSLRVN